MTRAATQAGAALCIAGMVIIPCAACNSSPPPLLAERAYSHRRSGELAAAYDTFAQALCAHGADMRLARDFVVAWDGLGRPGWPAARLADCDLPRHVVLYIDGLAAATADPQRADVFLEQAARHAPAAATPEILYRRGLVMLLAGKPAAALELLRDVAARAPRRADVRVALAQARLALEDYAGVVRELRGMVTIEPSATDLERARRLFRLALQRSEPPLPEGVRGMVEDTLGCLDADEVDRPAMLRMLALAGEFEHPRVMSVAGVAALRMGVEHEGQRLLAAAARLNRLDPYPLRALGTSYLASQRFRQALGPLKAAAHRDPLDLDTARKLATAASRVGEIGTARGTYEMLIRLEPSNAQNYLALARIARETGDLLAAGRAVERAYALTDKDIPTLVERAVIHANIANRAQSHTEREAAASRTRDTIAQLLEIAPDHPGAAPIMESLGGS